ncbi:hypothetical protein MFLAVUS_002784 [Mucor flavus]|uniref:HCP-like protein n=1 Tax=Mucor flavus TaxID=439312 RepID=A0ABP9YRA8_9FUNG
MFRDISKQQYDPHSFQHITPNSRIIPAPSTTEYHTNKNDTWRQPARTSSLQKPLQYKDRESLIDPTANNSYEYRHQYGYTRDTYIEPDMSTLVIDPMTEDYYSNTTSYIPAVPPVPNMNYFHQQQYNNDPEIQTVTPPKSVKSNVQYYVEESPIRVHQSYVEPPQPSVAVYEQAHKQHSNFALQPVPNNKKNNNYNYNSTSPLPTSSKSSSISSRLPKPPLTPLVIPPTPIRSTSSPNRTYMTPTRSSSIQNLHHEYQTQLTPGSITPGSSRSMNSPNSGISPFTCSPSTPSPNTLLPHSTLPSPLGTSGDGAASSKTTAKKFSLMPDGEAERCVYQGIKYHEAGKLEQATEMFKQASILDLPMGMFLYGVSLRHGWGCKKNEHLAFQYLQKSAEHAVVDLNRFSATVNTSATKGELIMAIYELGVSFRHGWGCKKNKETAVYYFKIAADLNDADAQNDLGHCYYHGHGVKKDMFLAAKYYRLADKQGQGIMGNSWIWKSKYDSPSSHK